MMWRTHFVGGIASLWLTSPVLAIPSSEALAFALSGALLGALLPDLDASESAIRHFGVGRGGSRVEPLIPLSNWIYRRLGHRGLLHSAFGLIVVLTFTLPLIFFFGPFFSVGVALGFASHLCLDGMTKSGVPLWAWPRRKINGRKINGRQRFLPRRWSITTGSEAEEVVFALLSGLSIGFLLSCLPNAVSYAT